MTGKGVLIYNAGSKYPSTDGTVGSINFSSAAVVDLSAATTGRYAGIAIFQERDNAQTLSFGGSAAPQLERTVYAPAAVLSVNGDVQIVETGLVVNELQVSGSGSVAPDAVMVSSCTSAPGVRSIS